MGGNPTLRNEKPEMPICALVLARAPDGTALPAPTSSDSVSLYTAVQEQLGLKLEAQRSPVDVLVIESVQRPVEN
jgi:uncharacterized protein (TIGR03435 family)